MTRNQKDTNADDMSSAEILLPKVYDELRRIAAQKMANESAGHTLQATALVHEAWLRIGGGSGAEWNNRAHFFGAAAEAMRRILVDRARNKRSQRRGAGAIHESLTETSWILAAPSEEALAIDDALDALEAEDPQTAEFVKLRYFVGMTVEEAADAMNISKRSAEGLWTYAKAWLGQRIRRDNIND